MSCNTCIYSNFGKSNCFRLMNYAEPKIDLTKGIECGDKLIHWKGDIKNG